MEMATRKNGYYVELIQQLTADAMLPGAHGHAGDAQKARREDRHWFLQPEHPHHPAADRAGRLLRRSGRWQRRSPTASPTRRCFLLGAKLLNLDPKNCMVVEDADAGVEAALNGDMRVLGVGSASANPKATFTAASLADADFDEILK